MGARDGAVAVLFALCLAALVGVLALAMDLGRAWNLHSQLEYASESAALAAATQLDGSAGARQRAILAASGTLARNRQSFATDALGAEIVFDTSTAIGPGSGKTANADIRFFAGSPLSDPVNEASSDADARIVQVAAPARRVDFSFAAAIGAGPSVVPRARAAAVWRRLYCDTPAILMCNPNEAPAGDPTAPFDPSTACDGQSCVGRGITLRQHTGSGPLAPGEWSLLSLDVFDGASGTTTHIGDAATLSAAVSQVVTPQNCAADARVRIGPPPPSDIAARINVRFDIYAIQAQRTDSDFQPAANTVKGLVLPPDWTATGGQCRYATVDGAPDPDASDWLMPAHPYDGPGRHANLSDPGAPDYNPIEAMGYPRDACAYPPSQVDESVFGPIDGGVAGCMALPPPGDSTPAGSPIGSGQYDLATYLAVYHPGLTEADLLADGADLPNSLVPPVGSDGRISRWELYTWEKRSVGGSYPNLPAAGAPRCYRPGGSFGSDYVLPEPPALNQPDRRLLLAAVINCASAGGTDAVTERAAPVGAIAVFLTEPIGTLVPDGLYGEMVDPRALGDGRGPGFTLFRDQVVLLE